MWCSTLTRATTIRLTHVYFQHKTTAKKKKRQQKNKTKKSNSIGKLAHTKTKQSRLQKEKRQGEKKRKPSVTARNRNNSSKMEVITIRVNILRQEDVNMREDKKRAIKRLTDMQEKKRRVHFNFVMIIFLFGYCDCGFEGERAKEGRRQK